MTIRFLAPGAYYILRKDNGACVGRYQIKPAVPGAHENMARAHEAAIRRRARNRIDKLDNAYGAYNHMLVRADMQPDGSVALRNW